MPKIQGRNVAEDIRRRLMEGEILRTDSIPEEYGVSREMLGHATRSTHLAEAGYKVIKTDAVRNGVRVKQYQAVKLNGKKTGEVVGSNSGATGDFKKHSKSAGVSSQIRRRFEEGETITVAQVIADYGVARSILRQVIFSMKKAGSDFDKIHLGHNKYAFKLKGAKAPKTVERVNGKGPVERVRQLNGYIDTDGESVVTFPMLTSHLQVTGLAMDKENGGIVMQLDDGDGTWLVKINGQLA